MELWNFINVSIQPDHNYIPCPLLPRDATLTRNSIRTLVQTSPDFLCSCSGRDRTLQCVGRVRFAPWTLFWAFHQHRRAGQIPDDCLTAPLQACMLSWLRTFLRGSREQNRVRTGTVWMGLSIWWCAFFSYSNFVKSTTPQFIGFEVSWLCKWISSAPLRLMHMSG